MLRNYIKIAWRNLKRNKSYALINTLGLSVGIASCILIFLFIQDEWSYDRYHKDADQIYRVYQQATRDGETRSRLINSAQLGVAIKSEIPGVKNFTRLSGSSRDVIIEKNEDRVHETDYFFAEESIFDVFSFELIKGNPQTSLDEPFQLVITESMAGKYFKDENPMGKTITIKASWGAAEYKVSGVMKDVPSNSHFNINFLTPLETYYAEHPREESQLKGWRYASFYTYIKLQKNVKSEQLKPGLKSIITREYGENAAQFASFKLQPLTDIHLYSSFQRELSTNSDVRYIYIFGSIAFLILIIAGVNYMNLATARSAERATEVGIKKTLGVRRRSLVAQFLCESTIFCLLSIVIGLFLVELMLPFFNNLTGKALAIPLLEPVFYVSLLSILLVIGCLAGLYPALVLSKFSPSQVFRGGATGRKKSSLRNALIVFQFVITVALIASTLVINRQLDYVQEKRLGLNEEQVVSISTDSEFRKYYSAFRNELMNNAAITDISHVNPAMPTTKEQDLSLAPEGLDFRQVNTYAIGRDFLQTMEIGLKKGSSLDNLSRDSLGNVMPVLINEAAARAWGWDEPLGKTFEGFSPTLRVVGVVEDFNYRSLKEEIAPLVMRPNNYVTNVLVRIKADNVPRTMDYIRSAWNKAGPALPLVYTFMDDEYDALYKADDRLATIFGSFSLLAIVIACLGLFGLAAFSAERRTKEIGIRKILGATVTNIVGLLSKDFLKLVALGFIIAVPIAYYAMNWWLQDFAYKISIDPGIFLLAGGLALLIALATVSWQSIRAALANPVDSLRSE